MRFNLTKSTLRFFALLTLAAFLQACGINPITGEKEIQLKGENWERAIGKEQYLTTQQTGGGALNGYPELTQYVQRIGSRLTAVSHRPNLPFEFVVLDSEVPNAWALPGGKIAINWGLLVEMGDEAELAAVLGHEVTHATARHGARQQERGLATGFVLLGLQVGLSQTDIDRSYQQAVVGTAAVGANLVFTRYSRNAELEADRYGMEYMVKAGYDPMAAVRLQETFVRLKDGKQTSWLQGLFSTHPPSEERVAANRRLARQFSPPPGIKWRVGEAEYQRQIKPLLALKESAKEVDKGYKAVRQRRTEDALAFAGKAARMAPKSAAPNALMAAVYYEKGSYAKAEQAMNKAISKNDRYFRYYQDRAQIRLKQGNKSGAKSDLNRSTSLLPTAQAHFSLGQLALESGDKRSAIRHFQLASSDKSKLGQQAALGLAKLDLPQNPGKYIRVQRLLTNDGELVLRIQNNSPADIVGATLLLQTPDGQNFTIPLRKTLKGKSRTDLRTGVGPMSQDQASKSALTIRQIRVGN